MSAENTPGGDPVDPQADTEQALAPSAVPVPDGAQLQRMAGEGQGGSAAATPEFSPQLSHARAQSPQQWDAIILSSFGGPEGQEDVIPFLRNVTAGRGIPDERLEEVATHYRANGGVSPINEQNRRLRAALEQRMRERGIDTEIVWANRNWDPYVADVLTQLHEQGKDRVLVLATSAFSGYSSCRQYREDYGVALERTGLTDTMHVEKIRQFYDAPGFVTPYREGLEQALEELVEQGHEPARIKVMFAAHSVPDVDALASGPEQMREDFVSGSAYVHQLLSVGRVIMEDIAAQRGQDSTPAWELVFQSRSGSPAVPWLEPDVNDAIEGAAENGASAVVVVPLGFVSDHMEVVWDLDTEAKETAGEQGVAFIRTPTAGTHPAFVDALVDLLAQRLGHEDAPERTSVCAQGTWFDQCAAQCCVKVLRNRTEPAPTVAQRAADEPLPVAVEDAEVIYR